MNASLGSDNHSGVHPAMFTALAEANIGHAPSYGGDPWSKAAEAAFQREFGADTQTYFVFNGTAANVLSLGTLLEPAQAALCADQSHLWNDEAGAPERHLGIKLIPLPTRDGKLSTETIEAALIRGGDQHYAQPRAVSITQPTELGTVYSLTELSAIRALATRRQLALHVDGSRLIHAAGALECGLSAAAGGADAIAFGGTKNGLLFGEAIVFPRGTGQVARITDFKWRRKQAMQLPSKARFIAAQFNALLRDQLWREISARARGTARRLEAGLAEAGINALHPSVANSVFVRLKKEWVAELKQTAFFYVWDERTFECRLMTGFDTSAADVDRFVAAVKKIANANADLS